MNRKRAVIAGGVLIGLAALAGVGFTLLGHQPAFYRAALMKELSPQERGQRADEFVKATLQLVNELRYEEQWSQVFSEAAINAWLAEELPVKYAEWLPEGIAAPRLKLEQDGAWIAFQARRGAWSGVISSRLKAWVASPNELAIEIQSLSAGLIPIPVDDLLGSLVDSMNDRGWRIAWKQSTRGDVLVVSLDDADSSEKKGEGPVLEAVEILSGELRIAGRRQTGPVTRTAEKPTKTLPGPSDQDRDFGPDAVK